jgi:hypothetical protein
MIQLKEGMSSRVDSDRRLAKRLRSASAASGLFVLSSVFIAANGSAQAEAPTDPAVQAENLQVAQARAAFAEGIELAKQGRWIDALSALTRSNELRPHVVTTYNIGYCERSLGRYTRARKMLAKALDDHKANGEKELPSELVTAATGYLNEAERQIARVAVTVTPKTATLKVDGRPLELVATNDSGPVALAGTRDVGAAEVAPAASFDLLIDPGTHEFVVSAGDHGDVATTHTFSPGSTVAIQLTTPEERPPAKDKVASAVEEARASSQPSRMPAWIAFGVGGAGAIVGTVSGLMAFAKKGGVDGTCRAGLPNCGEERQSGYLMADISTGAFIVAGLGAGVGVAFLLTTSGKKAASGSAGMSETALVRPRLGEDRSRRSVLTPWSAAPGPRMVRRPPPEGRRAQKNSCVCTVVKKSFVVVVAVDVFR